MADCYGIAPDRLLREEIAPINISPQFRRVRDDDSDVLDTIRALEEMAVRYVDLERKLGRVLVPGYPVLAQLRQGNLYDQAEDIALQLRSYLGIGLSPIQNVPSLLEIEMGIRVFLVPLPAKVSGTNGTYLRKIILIKQGIAIMKSALRLPHLAPQSR